MKIAFTRVAPALVLPLLLGLMPTFSAAYVVDLSGQVTSESDPFGILGGADLTGDSFAGSMIFNTDSPCSSASPCYNIGPVAIGSFSFGFDGGPSTVQSTSSSVSFDLLPFEPATIQGPGVSYEGSSDATFTLNSNGTANWDFNIWSGYNFSNEVSISGTAQAINSVPEPNSLSLLLGGLIAFGLVIRQQA